MNSTKMKFKRTAVAALAIALVWMFLLPVQAFAEGDLGNAAASDLPAVISDEDGTADSGDSSEAGADANASESSDDEDAPAASC